MYRMSGHLEVNIGKCNSIGGSIHVAYAWWGGGWRSYCALCIFLLVEQLVVVQPFSMFPAFIKSEQYSLSLLVNQFNLLFILHPVCLSCSRLISLQSPVFRHCIPIKILYPTLISVICVVCTLLHSVNSTCRSLCMQFLFVRFRFNMTWKFTPRFEFMR